MIKSVVHFDNKYYGQKGDRDVYYGENFENSKRVVRKNLNQQGTSDLGLEVDEGTSWTDLEEEYFKREQEHKACQGSVSSVLAGMLVHCSWNRMRR